jgi:hypothetical protein
MPLRHPTSRSVRVFRNSRLKRSALHFVRIAVLSAVDLKVDAERLTSAFSQPD